MYLSQRYFIIYNIILTVIFGIQGEDICITDFEKEKRLNRIMT